MDEYHSLVLTDYAYSSDTTELVACITACGVTLNFYNEAAAYIVRFFSYDKNRLRVAAVRLRVSSGATHFRYPDARVEIVSEANVVMLRTAIAELLANTFSEQKLLSLWHRGVELHIYRSPLMGYVMASSPLLFQQRMTLHKCILYYASSQNLDLHKYTLFPPSNLQPPTELAILPGSYVYAPHVHYTARNTGATCSEKVKLYSVLSDKLPLEWGLSHHLFLTLLRKEVAIQHNRQWRENFFVQAAARRSSNAIEPLTCLHLSYATSMGCGRYSFQTGNTAMKNKMLLLKACVSDLATLSFLRQGLQKMAAFPYNDGHFVFECTPVLKEPSAQSPTKDDIASFVHLQETRVFLHLITKARGSSVDALRGGLLSCSFSLDRRVFAILQRDVSMFVAEKLVVFQVENDYRNISLVSDGLFFSPSQIMIECSASHLQAPAGSGSNEETPSSPDATSDHDIDASSAVVCPVIPQVDGLPDLQAISEHQQKRSENRSVTPEVSYAPIALLWNSFDPMLKSQSQQNMWENDRAGNQQTVVFLHTVPIAFSLGSICMHHQRRRGVGRSATSVAVYPNVRMHNPVYLKACEYEIGTYMMYITLEWFTAVGDGPSFTFEQQPENVGETIPLLAKKCVRITHTQDTLCSAEPRQKVNEVSTLPALEALKSHSLISACIERRELPISNLSRKLCLIDADTIMSFLRNHVICDCAEGDDELCLNLSGKFRRIIAEIAEISSCDELDSTPLLRIMSLSAEPFSAYEPQSSV